MQELGERLTYAVLKRGDRVQTGLGRRLVVARAPKGPYVYCEDNEEGKTPLKGRARPVVMRFAKAELYRDEGPRVEVAAPSRRGTVRSGTIPLSVLESRLSKLRRVVESRGGDAGCAPVAKSTAKPPVKPAAKTAKRKATPKVADALGYPPAKNRSLPPPQTSFKSPKGRAFTLATGKHEERWDGDPLWTDTWPILYAGEDAGKVFRSLSYGTGPTGEPRWHASTRALYWTYANGAPTGIGYDVAAFDTLAECLKAWGNSADQILDYAAKKGRLPRTTKRGSSRRR